MVSPTEPLKWYVDEGKEPHDDEADLRGRVQREQGIKGLADDALSRLKVTPGELEPVFFPRSGPGEVVVVAARWDLDHELLKLRVAVFGNGEDGGLLARGWRLETPDGGPGHDHCLHHLQPIGSIFRSSGQLLPHHVKGFSGRGPAIPLPATGPLELVAVLLLSLYGQRDVRAYSNKRGSVFDAALKATLRGAGARW